jgi:peptidoglycan/LPS O-acetylase OafA/YrhL
MLMVLLAHSGYGNIIPGGLGVTIFFFLSGYLITTLSITEYENNNTLNLKKFYIRRLIRLYPALFIALLLTYTLSAFRILPGDISLRGLILQLSYVSNYMNFFNNIVPIPEGTGILWSLAVEAHFYLLYPLLFSYFFKKQSRKKFIIFLILFSFIILMWRYYLILSGASEKRTYYGTDTRIDSILFGCILALSRFNPLLMKKEGNYTKKPSIPMILGLFIVPLGVIGFTLLYRAPFFRATLRYTIQSMTLIPIFWISIKYFDFSFFKLLNVSIMKRIGQLSYFIYLIHFSII